MMKEYNDKTKSEWLLNEDHVKIVCQKLIGYKFPETSVYTIEKIQKDQLRYSISKDMNDEIVRTDIYIVSNYRRIELATFAYDKIIIDVNIIAINDLYEIIMSEIREHKLNQIL